MIHLWRDLLERFETLSESSYKTSKNFNFWSSIIYKFQSLEELLHQNFQIRRTLEDYSFKSFFQTSYIYWIPAPKPLKASRTLIHQIFVGFKPKSSKEISSTSLQIWRTHEDHDEQKVSNKRKPKILHNSVAKTFRSTSKLKWRRFCVWIKDCINTIFELKVY